MQAHPTDQRSAVDLGVVGYPSLVVLRECSNAFVQSGIAGIMPAINHLGIVVTHTLAAILAWMGFG